MYATDGYCALGYYKVLCFRHFTTKMVTKEITKWATRSYVSKLLQDSVM